MENVYKFVSWEVPDLQELKDTVAYKMLEKLNRGEKLTRKEKRCGIFYELSHPETYRTGRYKLKCYIFDFSPFMKSFLVKEKYSGWHEVLAFDRTSIRENAMVPSDILRIIDLPEPA